jgi:phosphoribosylformylglycinamidine cyclo-ligase
MDKYEQRGVSASKGEVHQAIQQLDQGLYPNAFCKVLPDYLTGDKRYAMLMHADTAGTKTSLAYLYWQETGDARIWQGIAQDALVMNTDDLACTGVVDHITLSNTIGRNKRLIPGDVLEELINGTQTFIEQLADQGVHLYHAGGETADVGDIVRTLDMGFTTSARLPREAVITNQIQEDAVVIGLASDGQALYEDRYNSGIGSNGLTMARHELLSHHYAEAYPETYDPGLDEAVIYTGNYRLSDKPFNNGQDIGQMLLAPTRTYLPFVKNLLQDMAPHVQGLIHCTGGGQTKVKNFLSNLHVVKNRLMPVPSVFQLIQEQTQTPWETMYQVFNMGHRLEVYVDQKHAQAVIDHAKALGIQAQVIGYTEKAESPSVTLYTPEGSVNY